MVGDAVCVCVNQNEELLLAICLMMSGAAAYASSLTRFTFRPRIESRLFKSDIEIGDEVRHSSHRWHQLLERCCPCARKKMPMRCRILVSLCHDIPVL